MNDSFPDRVKIAELFRRIRQPLVVSAHPDDESFGLGAILSTMIDAGARVRVLCFTMGEGSSLGRDVSELGRVRAAELMAATAAIGIDDVILLDYPDGGLSGIDMQDLTDHVLAAVGEADALLVFDEGGVTGHPDHCRATQAALLAAAQLGIAVLAWTIPESVASTVNAELGTGLTGRHDNDIDLVLHVNRTRQLQAIACHPTQSTGNQVLALRLALQGDKESLRLLAPPRANDELG
jgi:LmbE family N-acetylglucosaminyl deacetylase